MYAAALLLALSVTRASGVEDWRPMGQGDPLRDPTHVYSPPQVQHVHYWLKAPSIALEPPPSRAVGLGQVAGWPQVTAHYLGHNGNNQPRPQVSTTPVSITTSYPEMPFRLIKSPHSSPFVEKNSVHGPSETVQIFIKPTVPDPPPPYFTTTSSRPVTFFSNHPPKKPIFPLQTSTVPIPDPFTTAPPPVPETTLMEPAPPIDNFAAPTFIHWPDETSKTLPIVKEYSTTIVYDTTTTAPTTTTPTTQPPLSFVIEGHSKVKKYGPLPESSSSIHRVNHNHLLTNLFSKDDKNDLDKFNPFRLQR